MVDTGITNTIVGIVHNFAPMVLDVVAADINRASSTDFAVVITYHDDYQLDTATFDVDDIFLTGGRVFCAGSSFLILCATAPSGAKLFVKPTSTPSFVADTHNQFVVTYTFSPPNGRWSMADYGVWSIEVAENQVGDYMTIPKFASAGVVGTFSVTSKCVCVCGSAVIGDQV
jgi:hypothetical protein